MKQTAHTPRSASFARPVVLVVLLVLVLVFVAGAGEAAAWHVHADAAAGGDGSPGRPFATLEQVEAASQPGDTIHVLPSTRPLDGGIQLKDGQHLIGLGAPVTTAAPAGARPTITNTTGTRYDGDAIRLANDNLVENLHVDGAARSGIFGVNAANAQIRSNLITNNLIQGNDLPRLERLWPDGFVLYQSQGNHFGGITLLACGPARSSYCSNLAPTVPAAANTGHTVIANNVIRDSNLEGIMLLTDTGVVAGFTVNDTVVRDLSQNLPRPESLDPPVGIVRSRAFTVIALNESRVDLNMSQFHAENVAPPGDYAADGAVFLTGGQAPVVNARVSQLSVLNPRPESPQSGGEKHQVLGDRRGCGDPERQRRGDAHGARGGLVAVRSHGLAWHITYRGCRRDAPGGQDDWDAGRRSWRRLAW